MNIQINKAVEKAAPSCAAPTNASFSNAALPTIILMSALLTACGGGGGGASSGGENTGSGTSTAAATSQTTASEQVVEAVTETAEVVEEIEEVVEQTEPVDTTVTATEELVVADTFLFKSNYMVDVLVDVSASYDYLTICYADDADQPDYGNCLLRAQLEAGELSRELQVTNDTDRLVVSAWDYDDAANPAVSYWDRGTSGDQILLN